LPLRSTVIELAVYQLPLQLLYLEISLI
jgi:hypothetical protein